MTKFKFILLGFFTLMLFSCNESTTNPINESPKETKIDLLCKYVWELDSNQSEFGLNDKLKFDTDRSVWQLHAAYVIDMDINTWTQNKWTYDSTLNIIIFDAIAQMPSEKNNKFEIVELTNEVLKLRDYSSSTSKTLVYHPSANQNSIVKITGNITFDASITNPSDKDLTDAKVAVLWENPNDEKTGSIFGIGSIDINSKTYTLNTQFDIPIEMLSNSLFHTATGMYNQGYIVLVWDKNLENGQAYKMTDFTGIKFGMVEDHCINFVIGDYRTWGLGNLLQGRFDQGYNYCKGWYTTTPSTKDGWQASYIYKNQDIKVVKSSLGFKTFKFPNFN